jgi:Trk K+ transport system NAD-binding subunit
VAAFEALDITAIDSPMATVFAIDNEIERPELAHWMYDLSGGHDIQEVEMTAEGLVGESIRSLRDRIPGGCLIAEIGQGADAHVPNPDELLEYGAHITFLGDAEAVREAVELFHPRD